MIITRTFKFKLYQSGRNKHLHRQVDIAGEIWNHFIATHRWYYAMTGLYPSKNQLMKRLTQLCKLSKFAHWNSVGSQARQEIIERIDRAYKKFFRDARAGRRCSPPKFKKVKRYRSFTLKQAGWKLFDGNKVRIQGRVYKYFKSREVEGQVKTVTVKRDSLGDLYLYFVTKAELNPPERKGNNSIGLDFGLRAFLTSNEGQKVVSPLFLKQSLSRLRRAGRELSRKKKGSNSWKKAHKRLVHIYQSLVNRRTDWFFKLAHKLTDKYDTICLEDLEMSGMVKRWGRKVSDLAFSEFAQILKWVAVKKGVTIQFVDRYFPSTKTCSTCLNIRDKVDLKERSWTCETCGSEHDRDVNAAKNIHREGASSLGLEGVRGFGPALV